MVVHGLGLWSVLLLALACGLIGLWYPRPTREPQTGFPKYFGHLSAGPWLIAVIAAWLSVLTGTYIVYPWYRAAPSVGAALTPVPRSSLLADPRRAVWHTFGMEWKEHVAWMAVMVITAVAFVVVSSGPRLAADAKLRQALLVLFTIAVVTAGVAGLAGAFITQIAPIR